MYERGTAPVRKRIAADPWPDCGAQYCTQQWHRSPWAASIAGDIRNNGGQITFQKFENPPIPTGRQS